MSYRRRHINPKIRKLKKKKVFLKRPAFWIFFGLLIIIIILYFVLFYPKFQVSKIEILGSEEVKSQDIENTAWHSLERKIFNIGILNVSSKSIFTIDSKNLIQSILNNFPIIENVEIEKKFPQSIILKIKERQPFAVFCPDSIADPRLQSNRDQNQIDCFFIDKNGIIFKMLPNLQQNNMIVLRGDETIKKTFLGENAVEKKIINIIYNVQKNLRDNFQIETKEAFISNPLIFKTSENWQIYFDPNSDIDLQITKMNVLLKDEIPPDAKKNIQYIYLQYKDKAYYK